MHIELARSNSRRKRKPGRLLCVLILLVDIIIISYLCFSCLSTEFKVVLIFYIGSGAYVVIDNRSKAGENSRETSSNDGNVLFSVTL